MKTSDQFVLSDRRLRCYSCKEELKEIILQLILYVKHKCSIEKNVSG